MTSKLREPANGLTHLAGTLLSVIALIILVWMGIREGEARVLVGFSIFGLSQLALYTASTLHHSLRLSPAKMARLLRFDCMMVFVLIAGTYTPVCLVALHGGWRWGLLSAVWVSAIGGLVSTARWMRAPNWVSTAFYLLMGWSAVIALPALIRAIPPGGMAWMVAGGIIYTVGAVIFVLERPTLIPGIFESHALWHICVLGGSFCFFWLMIRYIAPL